MQSFASASTLLSKTCVPESRMLGRNTDTWQTPDCPPVGPALWAQPSQNSIATMLTVPLFSLALAT